jgi:hypothetical protein
VPLPEELVEAKVRGILETFQSQRKRPWFTADTFRGLMRLRGLEAGGGFAEGFHGRKIVLAEGPD